ncbi:MAG: LPS assembly lipoprotein LptE [Pirellulaceae bacterium]
MSPTLGTQRWIVLGLTVMVAALGGCAHYQLGNRTLYRSDIRTVHVPMFESQSFRRGLGERVTEAVIKEIESNTPYKVVGSDRADTILKGELAFDRKKVIGRNNLDDPRMLREDLMITYTWTDQRGQVLGQPVSFEMSPTLAGDAIVNEGMLIPEAGQSITTAQEEAIRDFAKLVVRGMQVAW